MTRFLGLIALGLLCFSQWCLSQQTKGPSTSARNAEITIQGCVSGQNQYTLMQASTGAIFALGGSTERLASVRGKLIEVTGSEYAPRNSGELPNLKVSSFHVVSDNCPIQPSARAGQPNAGTAGQGRTPAKSPATAPYADPGTANQAPPNVDNPNIQGDTGKPSPGTGNSPQNPQ